MPAAFDSIESHFRGTIARTIDDAISVIQQHIPHREESGITLARGICVAYLQLMLANPEEYSRAGKYNDDEKEFMKAFLSLAENADWTQLPQVLALKDYIDRLNP